MSELNYRKHGEPKPCPDCGYQERHDPVDDEVAANNRYMTVMCTECGATFPKLAIRAAEWTDTEASQ